jgi:SAM-dependent methyltransferase
MLDKIPARFLAFLPKVVQRAAKRRSEAGYWMKRKAIEGNLKNSHYESFYTGYFGLSRDDYRGKRVLDIGCGPRGSLEWCEVAAECVGLDPLVDDYRALGIDQHRMSYINARSEKIPYPDGYFDIVTSFNSLDHVEDPEKSLAEIERVLKSGGRFLLAVEVAHRPTVAEPISILEPWLQERLRGRFEILSYKRAGVGPEHDMYGALMSGRPAPPVGKPAFIAANLIKQ